MSAIPPSYNDAIKYDNEGFSPYPKQEQQPHHGQPYPVQASYPPDVTYQGGQPVPNQNITYPPYPQATPYQPGVPPIQDQGYGDGGFTAFSDKSIRRAFIRKVYLIMTAQLLVTCCFIAILQFVPPIKLWVRSNPWFYYISYVVFLITYIALVCCPSVRRKYPGNFICLAVFTFAFSYMVGTIASFYDTPAVLSAAGITAVVCLGITIFALQTKIDFTMCSGFILVVSLVFLLTGLTCIIVYSITGPNKVLHIVYAGIGILLFSLYLIYDTQMIVGGHKYELGAEDYIEGALQLYMDIVMIFMLILSLFGSKS